MKKIVVISFLASLAFVSCSKKSENSLQDSNVMLEEPEVKVVVDSTAKKAEATPSAAPAAAPVDSTTAK